MTDPDSLFFAPFLAASSDGGSLIIFVVIALITIVSKLIEWYKNKANNTQNEEEMPTFNPSPSPRKSMEEVIRKTIVEQQQKGRVTPPLPGRSQSTVPVPSSPPVSRSAPRTEATSWIPSAPQPAMSSRPTSEPAASSLPPEPRIPEMPVPTVCSPTSFEDIGKSVTQLTDNIEKEARKTMDQAYSSAESSYNMTMDLLEQSARKAREQAKAVIANSLPETNTPLDLRAPGLLKKAIIMSEILASPKGLK